MTPPYHLTVLPARCNLFIIYGTAGSGKHRQLDSL